MKAMRKIRLSELKIFLSPTLLTGGFTLISVGVGNIFGIGAGMITAGAAMVLMGAPIVRD
ncbi:hypothetical protein SGFS_065720 [Streptomyces graminofaciens]|uniref:Uncharacterized protein n=1 Tax=Streptomyces graminofaciens TaxID=68212 RepID=A0ABN5VRY4_9ACTN|nr:hypothetical protein SGFS_065720 [Streptomyces graminofaciens]